MNEIIISPMIQNAIVILMGGIVTGLGTLVALLLSQRRDVKKIGDVIGTMGNYSIPFITKITLRS